MSTAFDSDRDLKFGEVRNNPKSYRAHVAVIPDADGGFSVIVLNLPGTGSCGDSFDEAIANVRDAILGVVESYEEDGLPIPWITEYAVPQNATCKWILVNG